MRLYSEKDNSTASVTWTDVLDNAYTNVFILTYWSGSVLNISIQFGSAHSYTSSNPNGPFIIHMKKDLFHQNSEVNTLWEDMLLENKGIKIIDIEDVLPVNCVLLPVQLKLSQSKVSQDQMDQEELPNTILTWPSVFIVDFVKLLVLLMLSLKDQTFKALPLLMKNFSTVKKNCLKMVTDGSHNSQETSNLKLEADSLLIDIFLFFLMTK